MAPGVGNVSDLIVIDIGWRAEAKLRSFWKLDIWTFQTPGISVIIFQATLASYVATWLGDNEWSSLRYPWGAS